MLGAARQSGRAERMGPALADKHVHHRPSSEMATLHHHPAEAECLQNLGRAPGLEGVLDLPHTQEPRRFHRVGREPHLGPREGQVVAPTESREALA